MLSGQSVLADATYWLNHFDLLSGNESELFVSHNSTSSGVGGGLTGAVFTSSSIGEKFSDGGNKVALMAIDLAPQPAGINIRGVRVCYESTSPRTYVSQVRIAEVQNPPATAIVKMDDGTDLTLAGPNCVDSAKAVNIAIPSKTTGPLLLNLRFNFGATSDALVIRGLGIILG